MATNEIISAEIADEEYKLQLSKDEKDFLETVKESVECSCENRKIAFLNKCASLVKSFTYTQLKRLIKSSEAGSALSIVTDLAVIHPFTTRDYLSFDRTDFKGFPETTEAVFNLFYNLCVVLNSRQVHVSSKDAEESKLHAEDQDSIDFQDSCVSDIEMWLKSILPKLVTLIGAHMNMPLWSSPRCQRLGSLILEEIVSHFACVSPHDLFSLKMRTIQSATGSKGTKDNTLLAPILLNCRQSLSKDRWYRDPFLTESFCWIISQIKSPNLSDHIDQVMATSLNFIDDHQGEGKIKGIMCLHHLMNNTSSEEMRWHNRAEVIYVALEKQIYSKEAAVIEKVLPCLLIVLKILEYNSQSQMDHHHSIMEILLRETEFENLLNLRRIYISNLTSLVQQLGIFSVRHLKTIIKIVQNYLEIEDGIEEKARIGALKLLHCVILVTWPRVPQHAETILKSLLKFIVEIHTEAFKADRPNRVYAELEDLAERCLVSLGDSCPDVLLIYQALVNDTDAESKGMQSVSAFLKKVVK